MNVFVLCTGRCGSVTFAKACEHIENYTSGHETRTKYLFESALAFPENHIEADCRLAWRLGMLEAKYGQSAYYVHLTRDPGEVAQSYVRKMMRPRQMQGQAMGWGKMFAVDMTIKEQIPSVVIDMLLNMEMNIEAFLRDKQHVHCEIERPEVPFRQMWDEIGAQGDIDAALGEFAITHNAQDNPSG